jgi:hypothetical protein
MELLAPPRRLVRLRDHRHYLVSRLDETLQRRDGKTRRSHEHYFQGNEPFPPRIPRENSGHGIQPYTAPSRNFFRAVRGFPVRAPLSGRGQPFHKTI